MNLFEALQQKQLETERNLTMLSNSDSGVEDTDEPIISEEEAEEETVEDPEDIAKDVEGMSEGVTKAEDTAKGIDDLQSLYVGLMAAQRNGGLTSTDAMLAQDLAAASAKHLGIRFVPQSIDMQSFSTGAQRAEYTALAIAEVKNSIVSAAKGLAARAEGAWSKVTGFIKRILFSWGRIQARAASLKKKLASMGEGATTVEKVTNPKVIKTLVKKGHTKIADDLTRDIQALTQMSEQINKVIKKAPKALDLGGDATTSPFAEDINQINERLKALPDSAPKPAEAGEAQAGGDGGEAPKKSWWKISRKDPVEYPKEIPALTIQQCKTVVDAITKLAVVRASKMREENAAADQILNALKHISESGPDAKDKADAARNYPSLAYAYLTVASWSNSYANSVLDYVQASLPGGKEAAKPDSGDAAKQPEAK